MNVHINGYALALFSIAKENKKLDDYKKKSLLLIEIINQNDDYIKIMDSKNIDFNKKVKLIKEAFSKNLNKEFQNFLFILIKRHKFRIINTILNKLIKFINEEKKIIEGIIYTSNKLSLEEIKKIENKISKILNKKVSLKNKLDSKIISGIKIQVGNKIIEDTISSRFKLLKKELLEKELYGN
jgi:F-type H+-transporting ATPase subunit delta